MVVSIYSLHKECHIVHGGDAYMIPSCSSGGNGYIHVFYMDACS